MGRLDAAVKVAEKLLSADVQFQGKEPMTHAFRSEPAMTMYR